jgi:CubicO group peptidase (beta-lactamase class C family)
VTTGSEASQRARGMAAMFPSEWVVEPGYEAVRDAFVAGSGSFGRGGGAYCAYVNGKPVVDLWAGQAQPDEPWRKETATILMSATKGLTAICVQILVDRGRIDLDEPVATYWPEFAHNGKQDTLVRQLLGHTAGVIGFDRMHEVVRHDGVGWGDLDRIAPRLAEDPPTYPPGAQHCYHALTIGWLLAELVRRVDGRTLGHFLADEVAAPLGLEAWIGMPHAELLRVARIHDMRLDHLPRPIRRAQESALAAARDPGTRVGRAFVGDGSTSALDHIEVIFNDPRLHTAEFGAGAGIATARALARCWAMMAGGGTLDDVRVLSPQIVAEWSDVVTRTPDTLLADAPKGLITKRAVKTPAPRTIAHLGNTSMLGLGNRFGPNPAAYGAEGLGGQFGFCDPHADISVGYVRSELAFMDVLQPTLTRELYRCAEALGHEVSLVRRSQVRRLADRALGAFARRKLAVPAMAN